MTARIYLLVFFTLGVCAELTGQQKQAFSDPRVNRVKIQGIWWTKDLPQSAAFQVNDSTFYYPDEFAYRKYEIKADSLFVFLDDGSIVCSAIVKLSTDTLILSTGGTEILYTRTEPHR